VTIGLLCLAAWRYFQSFVFTRLASQLAVMCALVFLAEAQLSMDFGRFFQYSWWLYHGLFFIAFLSILTTWGLELLRARNASAIADAIAMRDALSQLNQGRSTHVVELANQIENHDLDTFRHVDRVAAFAYLIGQEMEFGAARLRKLVLAGQMHDIGKIGLAPHILTKPGKLTDEEWAAIKQHPGKGHEIVSRLNGFGSVARIIRHHHEHFDGRGYPDGLAQEAIPLESRIISVADTFDALTSERPYRPAMSVEQAEAELTRVAGSQLDPECVETFLRLLRSGKVSVKSGADGVQSVSALPAAAEPSDALLR
jgi:HD-GYP domain-containing protein (c-di-GMP phosphodiesterase class II)